MGISAETILNDIALTTQLVARIKANIAAAKDVLSTDQLADAKAKLAEIQQQAAALDAEFDAALAAATNR